MSAKEISPDDQRERLEITKKSSDELKRIVLTGSKEETVTARRELAGR